MLLKKIKPTNDFVHIDFEIVKNDWEEREVYTPNGFVPIRHFGFIKSGPSKKIKIDNGFEIVCDPGHVLQAKRGAKRIAVQAADLHHNDELIGYNRTHRFEMEDGPISDFFDIEIDDPHWWYTSSIVSHNSIMLCNNAITSLKGAGADGKPGQDVLLVTFELDAIKTAMRCLGVMTEHIKLKELADHQGYCQRIINQVSRTYGKRFLIIELPPDECSVNHLYALLDSLRRTESWKPDVVVLDYLDLMVSRREGFNKDDYTSQKHVANEIRGFAKNEDVLVYTATQTNRSANSGEEVADLSKAAESFAKQFSLDYIVSLNQTQSERRAVPPRMRMFVAKNRNGPKHVTISTTVDYDTMLIRELE